MGGSLLESYCTNIRFYMVLKASRIPAHIHPVIERLLTYRNLINELRVVDARLAPQLRQLLFSLETRETKLRKDQWAANISKVSEEAELEEAESSDLDEEANLFFCNAMAERQKLKRKKLL